MLCYVPRPYHVLPCAALPPLCRRRRFAAPALPPPHSEPAYARGRITVFCVGESIDRKKVEPMIKSRYNVQALHPYNDSFHVQLKHGPMDARADDVFVFVSLAGLVA